MLSRHTDREFENELARLRERLLRMAGRVEEMIALSVKALVDGNPQLAHDTILRDRVVNQDQLDIDEICMMLLARWQPMASDLRLILIASKMATDMERIGDLAVNISERAQQLCAGGYSGPYDPIPEMARAVQAMVRGAIDAFVNQDTERAREVLARDDEVDELYHVTFRNMLARMSAGGEEIERCVPVQNVAKYLERMGDHATNLCEQVIFIVKGRDIRHEGKLVVED